ncbi:hypothetical protein ACFPOA_05740 [Lysobacter niabensis]|uniref:hypothetical protein n=1 Tax=Agrilutibacter niabensis TaxID=380628 RepID=UPI00362299EE
MFYLGLGLLLLLAGYSLVTGDSGSTPLGSKIPFDFGEYKNVAGAAFLLAGIFLAWLGIKTLRGQNPKDQ